jgi:hypothetical protein
MCETAVRQADARRLARASRGKRPRTWESDEEEEPEDAKPAPVQSNPKKGEANETVAPAEEKAESSDDSEEGNDGFLEEADAKATRQSGKASYLAKVFSSVVGYGCNWELQQFVYDLWMWSSLGGAKNAAGVSMRAAVSGRIYSPEYWRTRHAALIDLQRQEGFPTLFVTIAPYEWSAPYHAWILDEMEKTLRTRLNLPAAETFHLAHLLVETAKSFLTGKMSQDKQKKNCWREHVFSAEDPAKKTVRAVFGRLEFQDGKRKRHISPRHFYHGRGTVHLHMLVWLTNCDSIDFTQKIKAELPTLPQEPELYDLVKGSQYDWDDSGWPKRSEPTAWDEEARLLRLRHPSDAKQMHCRAYMPDVLAAMQCHMDVLASDGRGLLLQYVSSYTAKFSDSFATTWLNNQASDYAICRRVLTEYHPLEPEMWLQLGAHLFPSCFSSGVLRRIVVPVPWKSEEVPALVQKYMDAAWRPEDMSFLGFLRATNAQGQPRKNIKRVLVAAIVYSRLSDEFYGQWLILNVPFRSIDELWDPIVEMVPRGFRMLALCLLKRPGPWRRLNSVQKDMELEAHRDSTIENTLEMLRAHTELIDAYLQGKRTMAQDPEPVPAHVKAPELGPRGMLAQDQHMVVAQVNERVTLALHRRWPEEVDAQVWADWMWSSSHSIKPLAILGPAGSGKSTAVKVAIRRAVANGAHVGIACPTGMLASTYRKEFPDLDVDTIHGMFLLYKPERETMELMAAYDLVVIDEVSQLSQATFERLMRLWMAADRRPALVFVGDFHQLRGVDPTRALDSWQWKSVKVEELRTMRRCKCDQLRWKLQLLRTAKPSREQLRRILRGRRAPYTRDPGDRLEPSARDIEQILRETPDTTFVTISRRGTAKINQLAVWALFREHRPLTYLPGDPESNPDNYYGGKLVGCVPATIPIYIGMRVTLTRNVQKKQDYVNGMSGVVTAFGRYGVEVWTDNEGVVDVFKYTDKHFMVAGVPTHVVYFPIRLGYSTTLHKIQGATLPHVTVWLDVKNIEAAAYVALSRVEFDANWRFVGQMITHHFTPATGV